MSEPFMQFRPALGELDVSVGDVLDVFRTDDAADNPMAIETRAVYEQLSEICDIRGGYLFLNDIALMPDEGLIRVGDLSFEVGRKLCGYMNHAKAIAIFVATAGQGFTDLSRAANNDGDYMRGYVIDTFGSTVAENVGAYVCRQLEADVAQRYGWKTTNQYSPGYCNWPLIGQRQLFAQLPDKPCGITLTDTMLMTPIKSVSGIVGLGPDVEKREYACQVCGDPKCIYREIRLRKWF